LVASAARRRRDDCRFCAIVSGDREAERVFEDESSLAFLDNRPLFPGHSLLVPLDHYDSMLDVPDALLAELFANARLLARAMEAGLGAEGSFVAVNNRVSQSIPHLHVHVVPRTKGDGLRGFFWPRQKYRDDSHVAATRDALRAAVAELRS
jgi:histidine triad (HIT) family protein